MLFYVICLWETILCVRVTGMYAVVLQYMTLFWYVLSTYWYVPVGTIIHFLYQSVLGTYWYVPLPNLYVLNTLFL
jgi:hypothetical protein